jgi:hypothetical protein
MVSLGSHHRGALQPYLATTSPRLGLATIHKADSPRHAAGDGSAKTGRPIAFRDEATTVLYQRPELGNAMDGATRGRTNE